MTRVKRQRNAKITLQYAKNNATITRNNAGFYRSRVESGAAYVLIFRELRLDQERNLENNTPVLVNSYTVWGGQFWPQPPFQAAFHRLKPVPGDSTFHAIGSRQMVAQASACESTTEVPRGLKSALQRPVAYTGGNPSK
jgi:hypothetical protein